MAQRIATLMLSSLTLDATGAAAQTSQHILSVAMVWPRPMIAQRLAVKPVHITAGRVTFGEAAWVERILFKENVRGPYGLEATVSRPLGHAALHRFVAFLLDGAAAAAGTVAARTMGTAGTLMRLPLRYLADSAGDSPEAEPTVIATGTFDIPEEDFTGTIRLPLTAPCPVAATVYRPPAARPDPESLLPAGSPNGELVLELA